MVPRSARASALSKLHPAASAGPQVTAAPHSQRQVMCRPQEQAMLPTSICPGRNTCPRGQCVGGRTIHAPAVDRTSSLDRWLP